MAPSPWLSRLFGRARTTRPHPTKRSRWNPAPLALERLEDRLAPATLTETNGGTTLLITLDNANEALGLVSNGATYTFASTNNFVNGGVSNPADFSAFGTTTLDLLGTGLTRYSTIRVDDSAAGTRVTFNDSGANSYADAVQVQLDGMSSGVVFNGASNFGTSALDVRTDRGITVFGTVSTSDGGITLHANQQAGPTAGAFIGIEIQGTITSTGSGGITLVGRGGNDATGFHHGVALLGGTVSSTGTGDVIVTADTMQLEGGTIAGGTNHVTLQPLNPAIAIDLGGAGAGTLSLNLTELGNITAGTLAIGDAASGSITVSAAVNVSANVPTLELRTGGSILDGNDTGTDLTVSRLLLDAVTGVAVGTRLETAVGNLEARTGTGGVLVSNTGALQVGGVTAALTGITVLTAGDVDVSATGAVTVGESVTGPANVTLTAVDFTAAGENLTVQANVTIASTGGDIALRAGDNLTIAPTALVQTSVLGRIILAVDNGNADVGVGATATFSGASFRGTALAAVFGYSDNDTFNFSPSPTVPIFVNGIEPRLVRFGDTINLDLTGFTDNSLQLTDRNAGTFTFTGASNVSYFSIEEVNGINGTYDLVLDLAQVFLNGGAFGNGGVAPDQVKANSFASGGTHLFLDVAQDGGSLTDYFTGNLTAVRSMSLFGSSDVTNFDLALGGASLLGGLTGNAPAMFQGTPTNVHSNAASLPPGTFESTIVSINIRGSGADTLTLQTLTTRDVQYFADQLFAGSGNLHVRGALLASFSLLSQLTFGNAGGTLLTDASLVAATAMTVGDDATPNDAVSQVAGDGGFTTARFRGFNSLTVRGGTGSQTMTLNALDVLDSALTGLVFSGDNAFGNDPAADTINVNALVATLHPTLIGGAGDDTFNTVPGRIVVLGATGANRLAVDASNVAFPQVVTMTNERIVEGNGATFDVNYTAVGGDWSRGVLLTTGDGDDEVTVRSTAGPTTLATGDGDDVVTISPLIGGLRGALVGNVNVDAGTGVNVLDVDEATSESRASVNVSATDMIGTGFRIDYAATGGIYRHVSFTGGLRNDTIRYLGKRPGTVVLNGGRGNDSIIVRLTQAVTPSGLLVDGGAGINYMTVLDVSGGAAVRDNPTGPGRGFIQSRYALDPISTYNYRNVARIFGINPATNYIQALHHHAFGRNATNAEVAYWTGILNTRGRLAVVRGLEYTREGRTFLVGRWFQTFLGRQANPGEVTPFVNNLMAGQSEEAVLGRLLGSQTLSRTAALRGSLVDFYFVDLLRRAPSASERMAWVNSVNTIGGIRILVEVGNEFFNKGL